MARPNTDLPADIEAAYNTLVRIAGDTLAVPGNDHNVIATYLENTVSSVETLLGLATVGLVLAARRAAEVDQ